MLLVGLTGGIASGKTTIAGMFHDLGAEIIDADALAREVVAPRRAAWRDIRRTFGQQVLTAQHQIDRAALADIVFHDPRKLRQLTAILYPRIATAQQRRARTIQQARPDAVVIYDAAMLMESGAYRRMNRIILVKCDQATQIARARARSGLSTANILRRIRAQWPYRKKARYATHILDGRDSPRTLRPLVKQLMKEFQANAA